MPFKDGTACPFLETQRRRERGEFLIVNQALRFELEMTTAWPRRVHLWFHRFSEKTGVMLALGGVDPVSFLQVDRPPTCGVSTLTAPLHSTAAREPLQILSRRLRGKRWLRYLNRFAWLILTTFLVLFFVDQAVGMRTLHLRIASGAALALASVMFVADWLRAWHGRLDWIGVAHLLEQRYPDLSERLVTLVQCDADGSKSEFTALLEAETARRLVDVDPAVACPLNQERRRWMVTGVLFAVILTGFAFVPAFRSFSDRFFNAWQTPLVPFALVLQAGDGVVLRGTSIPVEATVQMIDLRAETPGECELVCEYESGLVVKIPMSPSADQFVALLENVRQSIRCHAEADGIASETVSIVVIAPPTFVTRPHLVVTPPGYLKDKSSAELELSDDEKTRVLRYSTVRVVFELDRQPVEASIQVIVQSQSKKDAATKTVVPVLWQKENSPGSVSLIATQSGKHQAKLVLKLEHGLTATLPLGRWTVHDDQPPRFVQPLRLQGGAGDLQSSQAYRIAADDSLRLESAIEDDEGLDAINVEYRVNDGPIRIDRWLSGKGRTSMAISDWLPLPKSLKPDDRVQFRIHVSDNRRLRRGELVNSAVEVVPEVDLEPQTVTAPAAKDDWITLRVDRSKDGFVKEQTRAQADDVSDVIAKIKEKLRVEMDEIQQLQRSIHLQPALMPAQAKQAEKIQKLNDEIADDLERAGKRFETNPALAPLAGHFFDIVDAEMKKSGDALTRFRDKGRPLSDGEKELPIATDALASAQKKLERMLDWNKMIADDRLDQWQIENLEKRQRELAQRLDKLDQEPLSADELAKQIEAIRKEQAKLAAETALLQQKSKLVQESLAALEQMRLERLAKEAQQLAVEQRSAGELDPEKAAPEIKDRLAKFAERQADLAKRARPFAQKQQGPDLKPASDAADALKELKVVAAIGFQREHEDRLNAWLGKLLPGVAVNKLREQTLALAATQKTIRADLEKLGQDLGRLNEVMIAERLRDLVKRQQELHGAIAKLPFDPKEQSAAQKLAASTAKSASDQLAMKDALAAFESMEKAQQQLQSLAAAMPQSLPVDRNQIKDAAERAKIEQVEIFAKEQKALREETERLLADWMKSASGAKNPLQEKMDRLAKDLLELSQKAASPEAKAMAKESMEAIGDAKKSMQASDAMKAKGEFDQAKKMDDDVAKKMELAVQQLAKLVQEQAMKGQPKEGAEKTAEALEESRDKMRQAQADLPKMPSDAQKAMRAAADKLADAASQLKKQAARQLPSPSARNPAAKATLGPPGGAAGTMLKNLPVDESIGKAWGQLPGELKTQMLQDFRARFGPEYAEMIQQYFERLAESSAPAKKK